MTKSIYHEQACHELWIIYSSACEMYPRTREIPFHLYLSRNLPAAIKNIRSREQAKKHPADVLGEIFAADEFAQTLRQ